MHLAFGARRCPEFDAAFERVKAAGIPPTVTPFHAVGNMQGPGAEDARRGAGKAGTSSTPISTSSRSATTAHLVTVYGEPSRCDLTSSALAAANLAVGVEHELQPGGLEGVEHVEHVDLELTLIFELGSDPRPGSTPRFNTLAMSCAVSGLVALGHMRMIAVVSDVGVTNRRARGRCRGPRARGGHPERSQPRR